MQQQHSLPVLHPVSWDVVSCLLLRKHSGTVSCSVIALAREDSGLVYSLGKYLLQCMVASPRITADSLWDNVFNEFLQHFSASNRLVVRREATAAGPATLHFSHKSLQCVACAEFSSCLTYLLEPLVHLFHAETMLDCPTCPAEKINFQKTYTQVNASKHHLGQTQIFPQWHVFCLVLELRHWNF